MRTMKMIRPFSRQATLWLGLAGIAILYVVAIVRLRPTNFFGSTHDDMIYFSSAQALAAGRGYIVPSLPGAPSATEYPILYPWILSWVWRWNPAFPGNLRDAIGITVLFGLAYVTLAFSFFRQVKCIGDGEALLLTAFCAFHPTVLFYSASVLSDIPFAALALGAMVLANRAAQGETHTTSAIACGVMTGLAVLLRIFGVPVAVGIFVAALARRAWKHAAIVGACTAPSFAWVAWRAVASAGTAAVPAGFGSAGPGFRQTWIYYTSYIGFRKLNMTDPHLVATMLLGQLTYLFVDLPGYFLSPLFHKNIALLFVCTVVVFCMVFAGMVRVAKRAGWQPIFIALPLTIAVILAWEYPAVERFLIPFFPFLVASLWLEGKYWASRLVTTTRAPRPRIERTLAAALAAAMGVFIVGIAWNFIANTDRAQQRRASVDRGALLLEKQEAYTWIRQHAPGNARVIAAEDGSLYLYTGRQAMTSIAMRPAGVYDRTYVQEDLAHMTDVATAIGATYWLASSDDGDKEWVAARPFLAARLGEIENGLPELFRSSAGHVRVYGYGCIQHPRISACRAADGALLSAGRLSPGR